MLRKKVCKVTNKLLQYYLPEEIISDPDIIISGELALTVFLAEQMYEHLSEEAIALLGDRIFSEPAIPFKEINLWILEGSTSNNSKLFENNSTLKFLEKGTRIALKHTKENYHNKFLNLSKNTHFNIAYQRDLKAMMFKPKDVEDIISRSHIGLFSIAIHRGEFFIHQSFFDSIESKEILFSSDTKNMSFNQRLFQALMFFKCYKNFGFHFSKEVHDFVIKVVYDANIVINSALEIQSLGLDRIINRGSPILVSLALRNHFIRSEVYLDASFDEDTEEKINIKSTIFNMIGLLFEELYLIKEMKHWKVTDVLFLTDCKLLDLKEFITDCH